jgi:hypothetical protein
VLAASVLDAALLDTRVFGVAVLHATMFDDVLFSMVAPESVLLGITWRDSLVAGPGYHCSTLYVVTLFTTVQFFIVLLYLCTLIAAMPVSTSGFLEATFDYAF